MTVDQFDIRWVDREREPQQPADPAYPKGIDVDISDNAMLSCKADLPYPARRCGVYMVRCTICGVVVGLTTAGRADDPRSVKVACMMEGTKQ